MGSSKQCIVGYTKLVWSYCDATFCLIFKADRIPIGNHVCINVSTWTTKQTELVLPPIAANKGVGQVVLWFHKCFHDSVQAYHLLASTVFLLFLWQLRKAVKDSRSNFMKLTVLRSDGVFILFAIPYKKSNTFPHYHSSLSSAFISFSTSGLVSAGLTFFIQ